MMLGIIATSSLVFGVVAGICMAKGHLLPGQFYLWKEDRENKELKTHTYNNPFGAVLLVCPLCEREDYNKKGVAKKRYPNEGYVLCYCKDCGYEFKAMKEKK